MKQDHRSIFYSSFISNTQLEGDGMTHASKPQPLVQADTEYTAVAGIRVWRDQQIVRAGDHHSVGVQLAPPSEEVGYQVYHVEGSILYGSPEVAIWPFLGRQEAISSLEITIDDSFVILPHISNTIGTSWSQMYINTKVAVQRDQNADDENSHVFAVAFENNTGGDLLKQMRGNISIRRYNSQLPEIDPYKF